VSDLHPKTGARFLLERTSDDGSSAQYRAAIYTPTEEFSSEATLSDDGEVSLAASDAPAALRGPLVMFARLVARGAAKRRDDGLAVWPARVLRWRPG
jgi:hypothetical protein